MIDRARLAVLVPAVLVGAAAVAATAHGGYEVAVASRVPSGVIAALYPLSTDGLALVAYAATRRLRGVGLAYAWVVVIAAAGLSGLAQAVYLASGPALDTSPALRFGVGAWPAVAGAVAAHLVFLLAHDRAPAAEDARDTPATSRALDASQSPAGAVHPSPVPAGLPEPAPRPRLVKDVAPAATARPRTLNATPTPPRGIAAVPDRAAELIAEGAGRKRLARELDISEYQARELLKEARA